MRIKSLYVFYREYFGYDKSSKPQFALAIRDAEEAIYQAFQKNRVLKVSSDYQGNEFSRKLTINFLEAFLKHLQNYGNSSILKYYRNSIQITKDKLGGKKRLDIDFGYCYDPKERNLIFLEYGRVNEADKWFRVFRTLSETFILSLALPPIEKITCWDLIKGTSTSISFVEIEIAPVEMVIETAKRLLIG